MNILLFHSGELKSDVGTQVELLGDRARYLLETRDYFVGDVIRVGELNGAMGAGTIEVIEPERVVLRVELGMDIEIAPPVSLILAIPRPQILKQVLRDCAMLGVHRIALIRTERADKSYFQSPVLEPSCIERLLIEGLAQGISTRLPLVTQHPRFRRFVEDDLGEMFGIDDFKLLADPRSEKHLAQIFAHKNSVAERHVVMAVGPEKGWNDFERELLQQVGFESFNLGARILRVDVAVDVLLGQIDLLKRLAALDQDRNEN